MTRSEFLSLCNTLTIHPSMALENEEIRKALAKRDDAKVKHLLETEF